MKYGHDPAGMRMNGTACADMGRNAKQEETAMLAQQRYQKILDSLEEHGIVHSADLVREMKVSSETVRKDLDALEQSGKLKRVHGGAVPISQMPAQNGQYISLKTRNSSCMEEKAAIAAYAAGMVREHQAVGLDYGSTSLVMAKELVRRFEHLTVVTNSIQNALVLSERPEFTVILTGGILDKKELSLGNDFFQMIESLHLDILFMSVSGVHPCIGLTDQGPSEARVQKQMRQIADRTVVLADSSKFGKASLVKLCALCDVDQIITDGGLETDMEQKIKDTGVTLHVVRNGER